MKELRRESERAAENRKVIGEDITAISRLTETIVSRNLKFPVAVENKRKQLVKTYSPDYIGAKIREMKAEHSTSVQADIAQIESLLSDIRVRGLENERYVNLADDELQKALNVIPFLPEYTDPAEMLQPFMGFNKHLNIIKNALIKSNIKAQSMEKYIFDIDMVVGDLEAKIIAVRCNPEGNQHVAYFRGALYKLTEGLGYDTETLNGIISIEPQDPKKAFMGGKKESAIKSDTVDNLLIEEGIRRGAGLI